MAASEIPVEHRGHAIPQVRTWIGDPDPAPADRGAADQGPTDRGAADHGPTAPGAADTRRLETAVVRFAADGMHAIGGARAAWYVTEWELEVGDGWRTRTLRVTTRGFGWRRTLDLERSSEGEWRAEARGSGDVDLPEPGLADPSSVAGALDCDLGLCPLTNTMPIRRLGLLEADVPETALVMAWVEVPSLRVIRSDQAYASSSIGGIRRVRFRSLDGDFVADLEVDAEGLVVDYPGIGRLAEIR